MWGNMLLGGGLRSSSAFLASEVIHPSSWTHGPILTSLLLFEAAPASEREQRWDIWAWSDKPITKVHLTLFRQTIAMVLYRKKKQQKNPTHKFAVSSQCEHHHGLRSAKTELMTECCSTWRLFKSHWRKRVVQHCVTRSATAKANRDETSRPWRIGVSLLREGTSWNWHSSWDKLSGTRGTERRRPQSSMHSLPSPLCFTKRLLGLEWKRQVSCLQPVVNPANQLLMCYCASGTHSDVRNGFVGGKQQHCSP